jgi:hypothetical protein
MDGKLRTGHPGSPSGCHLRMIHIAAKTQNARTPTELYMNGSVKNSLNSDIMALSSDRLLVMRWEGAHRAAPCGAPRFVWYDLVRVVRVGDR